MPESLDFSKLKPREINALLQKHGVNPRGVAAHEKINVLRLIVPKNGGGTRRKHSQRWKYLTTDELVSLFAVIKDVRDLALFEVAYHRGLRASEVGRLQMAHLHLDRKRLHVERLKMGRSLDYPLSDREIKALRNWIRRRGTSPGPVFPSRNHQAISRRRLDQMMKHYGALAGIPEDKRHFHALRHSCATQLVERDVDLLLIQDHLGHLDVRSTAIYAKVTDRKRQQLGDKLFREW